MSLRFVLVLALAVICGASAAVGMSRLRSTPSAEVETTPVLLAKMEITRGNMVGAEMVELRDWPKKMVPPGTLSKAEDAVGRAAVMQIMPGDLMLNSKLALKDAGRGLAPLIPDGMRAFTIQTSKLASNVAGFVLPGNRVDVLLTLKGDQNDGTGGGSSTTLLQSVEILAVDQRLDAPAENKTTDSRSVTLLVTPRQAAFLDLGQNLGQLTLSLRNPQDRVEGDSQPATLSDLRFRQEPLEAPQPVVIKPMETATQPATPRDTMLFRIRTLRGSNSGEVSVSKGIKQ